MNIDIIVDRLSDITRELEELTQTAQDLLQEAAELQFAIDQEEEMNDE